MSLDIALVSDIHHGSDSTYVRGTVALPLLEEVIEKIRRRRPALLVDLGDRIGDTEPRVARDRLEQVATRFHALSLQKHHLLGNHDTTEMSEQEAALRASLVDHSLELGGWQLVFLYTFDGSVEGSLKPRDLGWLGRVLASSPLPAVVFTHQPLDGQPVTGNVIFHAHPEQAHPRGHEAARRIMEASGKVVLAVSGHTHWNHVEHVNGIFYLTVTSLVPPRTGKDLTGAYAVLALGDGGANVRVYGREPFEADLPFYVRSRGPL